jgi:copper resistance protein B
MSTVNPTTAMTGSGLLRAVIALVLLPAPVIAQEMDDATMPMPIATETPAPMPTTPAEPTQPVEPALMDHAGMPHSIGAKSSVPVPTLDPLALTNLPMAAGEPITPIPPLSDSDRAAAFPELTRPMEHASPLNHYVLLDQLEWQDVAGGAQAWDGKSWIGTDLKRLWLRTEGEREHGRTDSAFAEALYGQAISPWWDLLIGVRNDFRPGPQRTWAAVGVQGLAPYKFDIEATAYLGESGRTHARFEAEYDLLLSNRLILQPQLEAEWYSENDRQRRIGAGLSSVELGLRLRYEWRREFAPYLGVVGSRLFGDSADFARADGARVKDTRLVAGIRLWF